MENNQQSEGQTEKLYRTRVIKTKDDLPKVTGKYFVINKEGNPDWHYFNVNINFSGRNSEERWLRTYHAWLEEVPAPAVCEGKEFQQRVYPWLIQCFGEKIAGDKEERNHRFLEESLELVQSAGCTVSEAHQLVDYVFGREVGELKQEVGGVMVTLAALCLAQKVDINECGEAELTRIWTKVENIRAKQAAKPKHSPLPATPPQADHIPDAGEMVDVQDFLAVLQENWQAQIAGYNNVDKTEEERKIRNAVIEEYADLISIYKHKKSKNN